MTTLLMLLLTTLTAQPARAELAVVEILKDSRPARTAVMRVSLAYRVEVRATPRIEPTWPVKQDLVAKR